MVTPRRVLFVLVLSCVVACHTAAPADAGRSPLAWRPRALLPGKPSLRGLSAVDATTAWVSGEKGTIARTLDGGATWQSVAPPDCGQCDFRDIEAFDANTAVAMVAGQPARVYRTTDGGASWRIVLEDARKEAFFDGIAFAGDVGMLFGDPIDGAFCVWTTHDGGATWTPVPREQLPAPLPGEAAFAASGTCVAVSGEAGREQFWVATGGGPRARVLHGDASSWRATDVPLRAGAASQGGFGMSVRGERIVLVGGDYKAPTDALGTGAYSEDGGRTWHEVTGGIGGFRSAAVMLDDEALLAAGSHGLSVSVDGGRSWRVIEGSGAHALALAKGTHASVWQAGADGCVVLTGWYRPAPLRLASIFSDHMVLPIAREVVLRGWADPGESLEVRSSWGFAGEAMVQRDGTWSCAVRTPGTAGGPHTITVTRAGAQVTVRDVLCGDVWLASGQSNMEMELGVHGWSHGVRDHEREEQNANYPTLRVFTVKQAAREQPADDVEGQWVVCSPQTAGTFSATAYLFASELVKKGVQPLGLVVSSWGGTVCEAWASEQGLGWFGEFHKQIAELSRAERVRAFWSAVDRLVPFDLGDDEVVPGAFSRTGLAAVDGVVSFVRSIEIPEAMRGKSCWLELGPIDDFDDVSWNGDHVGGLDADGSWTQPRRYLVAADRMHGPTARLVVRVLDTGGEGGFTGKPEQLRLVAADDPALVVPLAGAWERSIVAYLPTLPPWPRADGPNRPTVLWNGMIAPLLPFPFTGAIWYQGESNRNRAEQYARLFPAMIRDWRRAIGGELPFYFVQIAPFDYENDRGETAALREAQAKALALPHTGMAVTLDCGDADDIHPTNKRPVGERLAALALAQHYGRGGACEGPTLKTATRRGDEVVLTFAHTDGGMQLVNGGAGWEIASDDGVFAPANARVDGDDVVLAAASVAAPTQVRYAWAAVPAWSLRNGAGFLAAPFRATLR